MSGRAGHFVGRSAELGLIDRALAELDRGRSGTLDIRGEPGVGKTRLLAELADRADTRGAIVLLGAASELERDLPFAVFLDALDQYLGGLDPRLLDALEDDVRTELAFVFPSLARLATRRVLALQNERYRTHRAIRTLLELLAATRPVVLVLDDLHWADAASIELLGGLLRRPPGAGILMAMAVRPRHVPERLVAALDRSHRANTSTRIDVGPLSLEEAQELLADLPQTADFNVLYEESGGNPFYLEQLARWLEPSSSTQRTPEIWLEKVGVPPAVAASLSEELGLLSDNARRVLQGAAVAGDPFDPELAAAAAATSEATTMDAIDELLRVELVRATDVPRRFRFRHPLVRRAVYEATAGGWRLGAHERCARALETRGAPAVARAHHLERSAREGDPRAIAVLREAGEVSVRLAPASAARWFGEALRLLPAGAPPEDRVELLAARAGALTAVGQLPGSHSALLEAIAIAPPDSHAARARLIRACAGVESVLGLHQQAHDRLRRAIAQLPDSDSPEGVALMVELAMNGFWRAQYQPMREAAAQAVTAAKALGDASSTAAACAILALADSIAGAADEAEAGWREAATLVDALPDEELVHRLDAAAWLAGAELYLDRYVDADGHAGRALALGRASGQGELFLVLVQILGRVWFVRGKLADATELLDGGIESARLSGNTQAMAWNLFNRSAVALATGDMELAIATAEESVELCRDLGEGFHSAWAAVRLAGVLFEVGEPSKAEHLLLECAGGEELARIPGSWRAYCLELLTRSRIALDRHGDAERSALCAEAWASAVQLPLATAWSARARAAVELLAGDPARAAKTALASAATAESAGAPIESALGHLLAGRAFAAAGQVESAGAELERASAELEACGALRYRDAADLELRRLGRRIHRRTRRGTGDGLGIDSLTEREFQIVRLVVDRLTNAQIAGRLFLSQKTVETHLRNIFNKVNVSSRVELARAFERADRAGRVRRLDLGSPETRI